jgi:hypothetical protein
MTQPTLGGCGKDSASAGGKPDLGDHKSGIFPYPDRKPL